MKDMIVCEWEATVCVCVWLSKKCVCVYMTKRCAWCRIGRNIVMKGNEKEAPKNVVHVFVLRTHTEKGQLPLRINFVTMPLLIQTCR